MSVLQLRKRGRLFLMQSGAAAPATETRVRFGAAHLFNECTLASDVTLRDVLELLNDDRDLAALVSAGSAAVQLFVTEGLRGKGARYTGRYEPGGIEYLQVSKWVEIDKTPRGPSARVYLDFGGVGWKLRRGNSDGWKRGQRIPYSVSLSRVDEFVNIPLRLAPLRIYSVAPKQFSETTEYAGCTYSLGEILRAVVYELTWHGSPSRRDSFRDGLVEQVAALRVAAKPKREKRRPKRR